MRIIYRQVYLPDTDDFILHYEYREEGQNAWSRVDIFSAPTDILIAEDPRINPMDRFLIERYGNDVQLHQIASTAQYEFGIIPELKQKIEKVEEFATKPNDYIYPASVGEISIGGLTKRELFAAQALTGMAPYGYESREKARIAVEMADALIEELNKGE